MLESKHSDLIPIVHDESYYRLVVISMFLSVWYVQTVLTVNSDYVIELC
jgi:hypothetical protein